MSEPPQHADAETDDAPTGDDHAKSARRRTTGWWVLAVVAGALISGGEYMRRTWQAFETQHAASVSGLETRLDAAAAELERVNAAVGQLHTQSAEHAARLESLYSAGRINRQDWIVVEAADLLTVAKHRLLFDNDLATARLAVEAALLKLENHGDPSLSEARAQIERALAKLRTVEPPDPATLGVQLAAIIANVDQLPLRARAASARRAAPDGDEALSWWQRGVALVWQAVRGLVVVERTTDLKPGHRLPRGAVHQTLKLQLVSARVSALRGDAENFHASLDLMREWMRRYYDTGDSEVANVLMSLDAMRAVNLRPAVPDLGASLEALRVYLERDEPEHRQP